MRFSFFKRDLVGEKLSNEVEKMIEFIYVLKFFLQIDLSLFLSREKFIVFSNVKFA